MDLPLYNREGTKTGSLNVSDTVFALPENRDLVYQVATSQQSNRRQTIAHTKDRSEVRGGGRKPWRQKGTGRARHGSNRSPIWTGGGVTFGPTNERNFSKGINKASARKALSTVLSARVAQNRLVVVDSLEMKSGKTKDAVPVLSAIAKELPEYLSRRDKHSRMLIVLPGTEDDMPIRRATGNLPYADTMRAADLNALDVLSYPYLVMTKDAVAVVERTLTTKHS